MGVAKEKVGSSMCSRELKLKVTEITEESFEDHERTSKNEVLGRQTPVTASSSQLRSHSLLSN